MSTPGSERSFYSNGSRYTGRESGWRHQQPRQMSPSASNWSGSSSSQSASSALFMLVVLLGLIFATSSLSGTTAAQKHPGASNSQAQQQNSKKADLLGLVSSQLIMALLCGGAFCAFTWSYTYFDSHIPGCMPSSPIRLPRQHQGPVRWHLQYVMAPINGLLVVFLYVYWQVRNDLT